MEQKKSSIAILYQIEAQSSVRNKKEYYKNHIF